ncbi:MAG: hypothetical protein IKU98_07140 [Bacteroidaceae bacterium]|nr:hypothetical protein [Bacteroidaceae bacterium]
MKITIDEDFDVWCEPNNDTKIMCDPLRMFDEGAECGNCPILAMCEKYEALKYGIGYDEIG